jgi:hypothetical protein
MRVRVFYAIVLLICMIWYSGNAQRNNIWCFGDSAGINFNGGAMPFAFNTAVQSRGSCTSIADLSGNLLFYGFTKAGIVNNSGRVFNNQHQLMQNGDSILGQGWYYEMTIIPDPGDDSSYYLFSLGVTNSSLPGLYYSKIYFDLQNPLGVVAQKNTQLLNFRMVDCLLAVKHGNGRDWWVIVRESPIGQAVYNNSWYKFLVTPSGVSIMGIQNIGQLNGTNLGNIGVSPDGSKICFSNLGGLVDLFDFDRCTGSFYNHVVIEQQLTVNPYPYYWSNAFSYSGQYLYVSSSTNPESKLWQFDILASNIASSKTLIWQTTLPPYSIGAIKRGPDNKIYISSAWVDSTGNYYFPYLSNQYYIENMNLSVINSPDSAGLTCDFQPYSFYLGGKRTYWGLPNNPDYDLGPLVGSPCDTLVSINEPVSSNNAEMFVYYTSSWQTAFINAQHLTGSRYKLEIFDLMGKSIFRESGALNPPYFTKNLNCNSFATGVYTVVLITEKGRLVKRFVKE